MQQQQQQQPAMAASVNIATSLSPELQAQMAEIERIATLAYSGDQSALAMLAPFKKDAGCVAQARLLLDYSANRYALHLAANSLTVLLTSFFHTFNGAQTLEIRNYLLNYIANACSSQVIDHLVLKELVATTARVAKLGWRQDPNAPAGQIGGVSAPGGPTQVATGGHASIVETCGTFFRLESIRHHHVGVLLLGELIREMEAACTVESPSDHRKTSRHFRDHALLDILKISLAEIRAAANFARSGAPPKDVEGLLEESLTLFAACLSFDFIGSIVDETAGEDSNVTLQVPASWRTIVEDTTTTSPIAILGDVFENFSSSESVQAEVLNAFSCLASLRKSLFTNEDSRLGFMSILMQRQGAMIEKFGTKTQQGYTASTEPSLLENSRLFHEFTRFLGRFKYNFTLNDCVRSPNFEAWLHTLFTFTIQQSMSDFEGEAANSLSYLLGVWSRIASDVSALKMPDGSSTYQVTNTALLNPGLAQPVTHTHKIQQAILEVIPKICERFIDTRLQTVAKELTKDGGVQDDEAHNVWSSLFEEPNLSDQLKYLSVLCRFHYVHMKAFFKARLEPLAEQYKITLQAMLNGTAVNGALANGMPHTPANTALQLEVLETQLTMLIYILGATIGCERSLLLLPGSAQHFQQLFSGVEKMTTNDQLQILDAELISWVFQLLPVLNVRVEKSSENASAAMRRQQKPEPTSLNASRSHMAQAVIYFFDQFRRKFMNSLAHLNFDSYVHARGPSIYSMPTPNGASTDDGMAMASPSSSSTQSMIPTPEMISHGPQANIFSRTAFFLRQPMTPNHTMQLFVHQIFLFLNYISFDFEVVTQTLELFDALSLNYATSDHIAKLDAVRQFLQGGQIGLGSAVTSNGRGMSTTEVKTMMASSSSSSVSTLHMADMAFLHSTTHPRLQTTFFQILTRLVTKSCNVDLFPSFLGSFSEQFKQLEAVQNLTALPPDVLDQVILLIHKIHGVVLSIASAVVYRQFFEFMLIDNSFLALVTRLVESFWSNPKVIYPVLNFHGEFITNRSQRIRFDENSPNGVELFKASYRMSVKQRVADTWYQHWKMLLMFAFVSFVLFTASLRTQAA
jgi:hypothetical protein